MKTVNILEAKSTLSKLIDAVETGREKKIVIARHGRPVARLTKIDEVGSTVRLGIAKGLFSAPESIDEKNELIASFFYGKPTK